MSVPILYVIIACIVFAVLGAVFGVLWGRKHPSLVEKVVAEGKQVEAAAQRVGKN
jgi:hypothetical protein